jgi:hypothetical protein
MSANNNYIFHNEKLKNNFKNIISIKKKIGITKTNVNSKLSELKKLHSDMIKDNSKQIFLFCLDSFFYQYKIFFMEFEHIKKLRAILNNRMYCDYYKLHNIIIKFCKEHMDDNTLNIPTFPVYKDLEPFQEYRIDDIISLHESILNLINALHCETTKKEDTILHYNETHKVGFSISNFLNTLTHENRILQEQISLFVNYISFFHISQKKQLKKLHSRIDDFYVEVDENININYTYSINDIEDQDPDFEVVNENANEIMDAIENMDITNISNTDQSNTDQSNTDQSNTDQSTIHLNNIDISNSSSNNAIINDNMDLKEFKSIVGV